MRSSPAGNVDTSNHSHSENLPLSRGFYYFLMFVSLFDCQLAEYLDIRIKRLRKGVSVLSSSCRVFKAFVFSHEGISCEFLGSVPPL